MKKLATALLLMAAATVTAQELTTTQEPTATQLSVDVQLRIDGVKFYKLHTFQENDFFEQPALVYTLIENDKPVRPLVIDAQQSPVRW